MSKSLLLPSVLLLLPTHGFAQDPFQANQANPFGGRPAAADPFGGNAAGADPFAQPNPKRTQQPAKARTAAVLCSGFLMLTRKPLNMSTTMPSGRGKTASGRPLVGPRSGGGRGVVGVSKLLKMLKLNRKTG